MMFRFLALLLVIPFFFSACTSWLDQEPVDTLLTKEAFNNPEDLKSALMGVYNLVKEEDLAGRNWLLFSDLMAGNAFLGDSNFPEFYNLQVDPSNFRVRDMWRTSYRAINQLNQILASIESVAALDPDFPETEQQLLRGESLFLRALIYTHLVQYFALPWSEDHIDSLGVPLVLEPVLEVDDIIYPEREKLGAVYGQIFSDLQEARNLLPESAPYGRAAYWAATALEARLAFYQQDYETAHALSGEFMDAPFSLTVRPQTFFRQEGSMEEIWVAVASADNPNFAGLNWAYGQAVLTADLLQNGYEKLVSSAQQQLLDQSGYVAVDLRAGRDPFRNDPLLSADSTYSFKYEDVELGDDAPVFRLAEMILMRAETATRLQQPEEGLALLNLIRRRAFRVVDTLGNSVPNAASFTEWEAGDLTEIELLDAINRERRVELAFEGNYLFDLLRRRAEVRPGLPWNHPRVRLPIPQRELDANPALLQNPGY